LWPQRQKEDGLDGLLQGQLKMHQATILCSEGFLGKHDHEDKLKVGNVQHVVCASEDDGPFRMTSEECEARRRPKAKQKRIKVLQKITRREGKCCFKRVNGCNGSVAGGRKLHRPHQDEETHQEGARAEEQVEGGGEDGSQRRKEERKEALHCMGREAGIALEVTTTDRV
jgi:hypothetical protein